VKDHFAN